MGTIGKRIKILKQSMVMATKTLRICERGHKYYKSSDCPTCPNCEKLKQAESGFLALLSNPARNALLHHDIDTVHKLAGFTEKEILALHGIGRASLPILKKALEEAGLDFKPKEEKKYSLKNKK